MTLDEENLMSVIMYIKRDMEYKSIYLDVSEEKMFSYFERFLYLFLQLQNK